MRFGSDEIFQPDVLAKFVSVPIYNEVGAARAEREILGGLQRGEGMAFIDDVDLDTYCGRVGNLYCRHGLCPPFTLRHVAADWKASGIALSHIVTVIDRHLTDHRSRYYSGGGDALFTWVDEVVRKTWYERQVPPPWAQATQRRWNDFPIATGAIGNQALTTKSIPGAALPARKRPWPVGRMS